jgi:2-polyprenyl-3-methyl-5-hydroxy-6-metoxy-1,4-benzoquinol methylase
MIQSKFDLTAKIEPFDTFWEAPKDVEKGYKSFGRFYKTNYLKRLPLDKSANILVVCCGPGYFVKLLKDEGYTNVFWIDSDVERVKYAKAKALNCEVLPAFDFLDAHKENYDVIFVEQEICHLDKTEILFFLDLCWKSLKMKGKLIIHSLNGANPITGAEALAQNYDHYATYTEYSLRQILRHTNFADINVFPLKLYIFYENPLNYIGLIFNSLLNILFRLLFIFYGKENKIFSKKIAAVAKKIE